MDFKTGKYKHFKGGIVQVLGKTLHSETMEEFVLYKHVDGEHSGHFWVRPVKMFFEEIEREGKRVPRFKYED